MKRLPHTSIAFLGIALLAAALAVLNPAAEAGFSPVPPEVLEQVEGTLPSACPGFESREEYTARTPDDVVESGAPTRQTGAAPGELSEVSDHNETDNDLPFEESTGSKDASGGGTEVRRVLRVSSNCGPRALSTVDLAFEWLKKTQQEDGSWDGDVQTTGLVLLAFLGAGETHKHGRYKKVVREALKALKARQTADGWFTSHGDLGGQAMATLALCEAYRLTASPLFKQSSLLALDALRVAGPSHHSATWWMLFAQRSAKQGGLIEAILGFEDAIELPSPDAWCSVPGATEQAGYGAEILARIFAGEDPRRSGEIGFLVGQCLETPPTFDEFSTDPGALYLKTVALFQVGGDAWKKWNGQLKEIVRTSQTRPGDRTGYWESSSPRGRILGRTRTTALMVLTLEVYYRYGKVFGGG